MVSSAYSDHSDATFAEIPEENQPGKAIGSQDGPMSIEMSSNNSDNESDLGDGDDHQPHRPPLARSATSRTPVVDLFFANLQPRTCEAKVALRRLLAEHRARLEEFEKLCEEVSGLGRRLLHHIETAQVLQGRFSEKAAKLASVCDSIAQDAELHPVPPKELSKGEHEQDRSVKDGKLPRVLQ
ncbi:hypothetical protein AC578_5676 [Pseudocercospora eumusae]|uniref:Uncharacterized protein n=1 Tax=Pseudocercospora eumusae TaxID=321146 RepID=A0A139H3A8_9PEZI|nr:hypothetical protein AC578_5676 [Pseudocercospora eumusae]